MSYVFNRFELIKTLKKHGIKYDLNSSKGIDEALKQLALNTCDYDTWEGAGIERNGFKIDDEHIIKIPKDYYIDNNDEIEIDNYYEEYYDEHGSFCDEDDPNIYYNRINDIGSYDFYNEQQVAEIDNYIKSLKLGKKVNGLFAKIYAATSDYNIILAEYCPNKHVERDEEYEATEELFETIFSDAHSGNIGINRENKLVLTDLGMESSWGYICETLHLDYNIIA